MRMVSLLRACFCCCATPGYHAFSRVRGAVASSKRRVSSSTACQLNRLLFEPSEVVVGDKGACTVRLSKDDYRTKHVKTVRLHGLLPEWQAFIPDAAIAMHDQILKASSGDRLRAGIVEKGRTDTTVIEWATDGSLEVNLGERDGEIWQPPPETERPRVDVLLAMQAPLRLERMLPQMACQGVGHIVICGAQKVELSYWGSHLFREPDDELRALLVEGLTQAGDTLLPRVSIKRKLRAFLRDELEGMFPSASTLRVVAHPFRVFPNRPVVDTRLRDLEVPPGADASRIRMLLAIGPESGWEEPQELDMLKEHGFQQVTLGKRVLRTETAVPALLALAHDYIDALSRHPRTSNASMSVKP